MTNDADKPGPDERVKEPPRDREPADSGIAQLIAKGEGTPSGGDVVPVEHTIWVIITLSIFFGAFGGLVGTGIGLMLSALLGNNRQNVRSSPPDDLPPRDGGIGPTA